MATRWLGSAAGLIGAIRACMFPFMDTETRIRPATLAERDRLEALQRRAAFMWEEDRPALLAHPDAIDLPIEHIVAGYVHVAERQGVPVGFSVWLPRGDGDAELDGLFVEPAAWGAGVGRHLVRQAETVALDAGSAVLWVVANPRAAGFYAACGFERVGEEQTRFGTGVTMRKRLAAGYG